MVPLRRSYDVGYLADIGQPGTNGLLVTRQNALLAKCWLRAEFDLPAATLSSTLPCCGSWDDPYAEESHLVTTTYPFTLSLPSADYAFGRLSSSASGFWLSYNFGDCTIPTSFGSLGARGVVSEAQDSSEFTDGEYAFKTVATFRVKFVGIRSPWWGQMAVNPGSGYDAPEGHWAVSVEAQLYAETFRSVLPYYEYNFAEVITTISASCSGWFYSDDAFHRIRGTARSFSLGNCSFSTDSFALRYYDNPSYATYLAGAEQDMADALESVLGEVAPTLKIIGAVPMSRRFPS